MSIVSSGLSHGFVLLCYLDICVCDERTLKLQNDINLETNTRKEITWD
jgi:hypothetical protein